MAEASRYPSLIRKKAGEDFVALAVSREEDVAQIKRHLKDHPRDASVVLNNKAIWQTYDRRIITPAYYLIDQRGVIRMSGYGGSPEIRRVIDTLIDKLREEKLQRL